MSISTSRNFPSLHPAENVLLNQQVAGASIAPRLFTGRFAGRKITLGELDKLPKELILEIAQQLPYDTIKYLGLVSGSFLDTMITLLEKKPSMLGGFLLQAFKAKKLDAVLSKLDRRKTYDIRLIHSLAKRQSIDFLKEITEAIKSNLIKVMDLDLTVNPLQDNALIKILELELFKYVEVCDAHIPGDLVQLVCNYCPKIKVLTVKSSRMIITNPVVYPKALQSLTLWNVSNQAVKLLETLPNLIKLKVCLEFANFELPKQLEELSVRRGFKLHQLSMLNKLKSLTCDLSLEQKVPSFPISLERLTVAVNQPYQLHEKIADLPNLKSLDLDFCELEQVNITWPKNLQRIKIIARHANGIEPKIYDEYFKTLKNCVHLESFELSGHKLEVNDNSDPKLFPDSICKLKLFLKVPYQILQNLHFYDKLNELDLDFPRRICALNFPPNLIRLSLTGDEEKEPVIDRSIFKKISKLDHLQKLELYEIKFTDDVLIKPLLPKGLESFTISSKQNAFLRKSQEWNERLNKIPNLLIYN